jgi:hypothetical protein
MVMGKTIDMMGAIELDAFGADLGVTRLKSGVQVEHDMDYRERIRAALVEKDQKDYFGALEANQSAMFCLTLRDYFAAKAMQGFLASADIDRDYELDSMSFAAYAFADAMLAERAK